MMTQEQRYIIDQVGEETDLEECSLCYAAYCFSCVSYHCTALNSTAHWRIILLDFPL